MRLSLKNEGTQSLLNGTIEINENALSREYRSKESIQGVITNVLRERSMLEKEIRTITVGESLRRSSAVEDLDLKPEAHFLSDYQKNSEAVLLMAMFHCTDKKIALKDNLADYINIRGRDSYESFLFIRFF